MNYNYNKLRGIIKENGYTEKEMAKKLGMDQATFSRKINSLSLFDTKEIKSMIDILNIDTNSIYNVFFVQK